VRIYALGTGAPLAPERATLGLYVEAPGCDPLLLDACGGFEIIRQLTALGIDPMSVRNVVLTHGHGDHIGGIMALRIRQVPICLYGPRDALSAARELFRLTYPHLEGRANPKVTEQPVLPGRSYLIGGFRVEFFAVRHRVPTYAVRVEQGGRVLAYSADSLACEALIECARDADLFLCDALCAEADGSEVVDRAHLLMHPTAREAGALAQAASARSLALVHLARYASPATMLEEARGVFAGSVTVPDDLSLFKL